MTSRCCLPAAWSLRQKGYTQEQIAEQLKIDQGNVSRLLNKLNDRYLKDNLDKVERVKVEQTRILWLMVAEAMRAWEKSKEPQGRVRQIKRDDDGDDGSGGGGSQIISESLEREGNPVYLHTARAAMADIRSIWGADVAPAQQDAALGIAQLIADLEQRGAKFDASENRAAEQDSADPGGLRPGPATRSPEVQGESGAVQ